MQRWKKRMEQHSNKNNKNLSGQICLFACGSRYFWVQCFKFRWRLFRSCVDLVYCVLTGLKAGKMFWNGKTKFGSMMNSLYCLTKVLVMCHILVLLLVHVCLLMEQLLFPVLCHILVLLLVHMGLLMVLQRLFPVLWLQITWAGECGIQAERGDIYRDIGFGAIIEWF